MTPDTEVLIVTTTVATADDANRIAGNVVRGRLAACVQVDGPIRSFYNWEGKLQDTAEWRLTCKTSRSRFAVLRDRLEELHPYELPEIIATAVVSGNEAYCRWVAAEVESTPTAPETPKNHNPT